MMAQLFRRYSWDKSGRLKGLQDRKRDAKTYSYDQRDQITKIERPADLKGRLNNEQYSYDAIMNLANSNGQQHRYQDGKIRVIGNSEYSYDIRGRVITKKLIRDGFRTKTWHYRWDDFDRLIETDTPTGAIWQYAYDAFGRRIRKECIKAGEHERASITDYIWHGATLAEEHKTTTIKEYGTTKTTEASETTRWYFEPGTFNPLAKETITIEKEQQSQSNFYPIVTDHLGTPKDMFNADGNCVWAADHSLWGEARIIKQDKKKTNRYEPLVDCDLRFQNQWEDKETGLYYNLNRYYDPDSGQYLSQDPIGLEGGLRTHGYVHDPVQWIDPMGLAGCGKGSASKKPIIVGENMKRVKQYAEKTGGQAYRPWKNDPFNKDLGMKRNTRWIKDMKRDGREIIDIGPDFKRRSLGTDPSDFYNMERTQLKGYGNYTKVFERNGTSGGVPGLDF